MLDAGPLGWLSHPDHSDEADAILLDWSMRGAVVHVPIVADFEVRRELERCGSLRGLRSLDDILAMCIMMIPSQLAWNHAATLWARSRKAGLSTAHPQRLDADVLIAAMAVQVGAVVVTGNIEHYRGLGVEVEPWKTRTTPVKHAHRRRS